MRPSLLSFFSPLIVSKPSANFTSILLSSMPGSSAVRREAGHALMSEKCSEPDIELRCFDVAICWRTVPLGRGTCFSRMLGLWRAASWPIASRMRQSAAEPPPQASIIRFSSDRMSLSRAIFPSTCRRWWRAMSVAVSHGMAGRSDSDSSWRISSTLKPRSRACRMKCNRRASSASGRRCRPLGAAWGEPARPFCS